MAASPEINITHVEGSGTVDGVPVLPQGPGFFFPLLPDALVVPPVPPFFTGTGPQTPSGNPGGERANPLPPVKGLYKLKGPPGSKPGVGGRFSRAD